MIKLLTLSAILLRTRWEYQRKQRVPPALDLFLILALLLLTGLAGVWVTNWFQV